MPLLVESPEEVKNIINGNAGLSIFEFFSTWCEPCNKIGDDIKELECGYSQVKFYCMNVENSSMKALMKEYRICAIPSFILIKDGEYKDTVKGANVKKLKIALDEWLFDPSEFISQTCSSDIGLSSLFSINKDEKSDYLIDNMNPANEQT